VTVSVITAHGLRDLPAVVHVEGGSGALGVLTQVRGGDDVGVGVTADLIERLDDLL
jgi:hypothetical protein